MKIGILGGSFDPAHKGHLAISQEALKKLKLKKIIWAITKKNPLKKKSTTNLSSRISQCKRFLNKKNFIKIIKDYNYIVDGSDNFSTKFLLNDFCLRFKKTLITGAISKFDGHVFTFDFKNKKIPCLRCFFQEDQISDDLLNCEAEGVLGTVAGIVGTIQANEVLKKVLNIGQNLDGHILIVDLLNLNFRKVKLKKRKFCFCK